ncbi:hypothetical protein SD427_03380 [Chryseobacterium sp. JJR-5R]|uniref:hypothetical protein n=1 Tax=Chryseobacterium sp. JJR-5R TaxID=3093923 RepID=UPI002A75CD71|nr:hypothetical protein [Chryseobacterium sp. JJR-5R]WPO83396.1 hypothetical protein SD427_03380 [Chryseobacterium sp. JJR-5R]
MLEKIKFFILFLGFLTIKAQFPGTAVMPIKEKRNIFGGSGSEIDNSMVRTTDGGYALAGRTLSNDGDVSGNHGGTDFWIVKFSSHGNVEWKKTFGGSSNDSPGTIIQTADGGYAIIGTSLSNDGDVSGNHGSADIWLIKLNSSGILQWQKTFGGTKEETGSSIIQTSDGGYTLAGHTNSNNGDVTVNQGNFDFWVIKVTSTGILQWQKTFGGTGIEYLNSFIQTSDGSYIMAGNTSSNDGNVSGNHGIVDFWVVKINSTGTLQWQRAFGGTKGDVANSIVQTGDGGYTLAGHTESNDGNVSGNHGSVDIWVIKLNSAGTLQWQKTFGGTGSDFGQSIIQTTDGGYAVIGFTQSIDGDVSANHGSSDIWVTKLNSTGILQWQKALGGTAYDEGFTIIQTPTGYLVAGRSSSNDGDIAGPVNGSSDFLVLRLDTNGNSIKLYDDIAL